MPEQNFGRYLPRRRRGKYHERKPVDFYNYTFLKMKKYLSKLIILSITVVIFALGPTMFIKAASPTITSLNPSSATAGGSDFTLDINGTGFSNLPPITMVTWDGIMKIPSFISSTLIKIPVTTEDILTAKTVTITATNSGFPPATAFFQVYTPTPTITNIDPASKNVGDDQFIMVVDGTNFVFGASTVRFNGSDRATNFVSMNRLTATIPAPDLLVAGTFPITVFNSGGGGITPTSVPFTVNPPAPTTLTLGIDGGGTLPATFSFTVSGPTTISPDPSITITGWTNGTNVTSPINVIPDTLYSITPHPPVGWAFTSPIVCYDGTTYSFPAGPVGSITIPSGAAASCTWVYTEVINPLPTITTINPSSATVGDPGFTLTVNGTNYISSSIVYWGNTALTPNTTGIPTQLTVSIPQGLIATAGTYWVTVVNPGPGGGTSNAVPFTVNAPAPTTLTLGIDGGGTLPATFSFTVSGPTTISPDPSITITGWTNGTNVTSPINVIPDTLYSITPHPPVGWAFTSPIVCYDGTTYSFPAGPVGSITIPSGAAASCTWVYTEVINPLPTITSLNPSSKTQGDPGFTLTVNGTNFITSSTINWNGLGLNTMYVSATQLTTVISSVPTVGIFNITVTNPAPGGGTSNPPLPFTVNPPAPTLISINPSSKIAGSPGFIMNLTGTGFLSISVVWWNGTIQCGGSPIITTYINSTHLKAEIPTSCITTMGMAMVLVYNTPPNGGPSNSLTFTITSGSSPPSAVNLTVFDYYCPVSYDIGSSLFSWNYLGSNDESQYWLQVDNNSNFSSPEFDKITTGVSNQSGEPNQQSVLVKPAPATNSLVYNTTYYWRVMVTDSMETSSTWTCNGAGGSCPGFLYTTRIHSGPSVDFTFSPNPVRPGDPTDFTDQSKCYNNSGIQVACSSWHYNFGDGGSSFSQNPAHTYTASQDYVADLTVSDGTGSCLTEQRITVCNFSATGYINWYEISPFGSLHNFFANDISCF